MQSELVTDRIYHQIRKGVKLGKNPDPKRSLCCHEWLGFAQGQNSSYSFSLCSSSGFSAGLFFVLSIGLPAVRRVDVSLITRASLWGIRAIRCYYMANRAIDALCALLFSECHNKPRRQDICLDIKYIYMYIFFIILTARSDSNRKLWLAGNLRFDAFKS